MKKSNMGSFKKYIWLPIFIMVLAACAQNPFEPIAGQVPMKSMFETMQEGIESDEKPQLATVPEDINEALLPTLALKPTKVSPRDRRFDIAVNNIEARDFFMGLVKDTDYNMIVSPEIKGNISLDLKNVTINGALEAVRDVYGYDYEVTPYGYQVLADGLRTRMFSVNYLNMERTSESQIQISSGQITQNLTNQNNDSFSGTSTQSQTSDVTPATKITTKNTSSFWASLQATLEAMVADQPNRKVIINPGAGLIIVRAKNSELEQIAEYLDWLQDTMTRQVLLEAKILEVTLGDAYQAGIDWKILGAVQSGTEALFDPVATTGTDDRALEAFTNIFKLTATGGSQFSTVIDLLSIQGNVQVLSSPRVATLNAQKAVIKVGFDEFFITNVSNTNTTSAGASDNTQDLELTPFFSGIALDVTPQINSEGNVILHIHPIVSNVFDQTKTFVVSNQEQSLPLALSVIRESDSIVEARNGQVIVIGGLMEEKMEETIGATPMLNKIPFAGTLFRKTNQQSKKTELVILLKPSIIERGTWANSLHKNKQRLEEVERGFHIGDRYEVFGNMAEFPRK